MVGWLPLAGPSGPQFPATFLGNQDVTISAINTSGGIKSFWDTAQTPPRVPCLYQVSASEITATGTSRPYEDLHYAWDFGDPSGTEFFTRPTDGASVNANTDQISPEAAYCYRNPGTYTIKLTISGNGGVIAQVTKSVTIAAFTPSTTIYCDSNASGANNGTSPTDAFTSLASVNSALNHAGSATTTSNVLILLARGSTFTTGLGFNITSSEWDNYSGIRVKPYGTGALPIINSNNDINTAANHGKHAIKINCYSSAGQTFYDAVFEGIDIRQTNTTTATVTITVDQRGSRDTGSESVPVLSRMENVYFLDCPMSITNNSTNSQAYVLGYEGKTSDRPNKGGGTWNCTFATPDVSGNFGSGISGSPQEFWFMMGGGISGDSNSNFNHQIYPDCADHELYQWVRFGKSGVPSGRGMCVNMNWDWEYTRVSALSPGVVLPARYHCVSECETMGTQFSIDAGSRQNLGGDGTDNQVHFYGLVIQRCSIHQHSGGYQMQLPCAREVTVRDNRAFDNASGTLYGIVADSFFTGSSTDPATWPQAVLKSNVYRNKVLISPGSNNQGFLQVTSSNYTQPQQWTRNVVKDARSAGANGTFWFNIASATSKGFTINRNQLYSANNPTLLVYDSVTSIAYSWSAYQFPATAFDANGSNVDPGWSTSANTWAGLN